MNILIAADYATPASGNFIASCMELGRALKENNDSMVFIFPENENTLSPRSWVTWLKNEGFAVYLYNKMSGNDIKFLTTIIKKHKIDIVNIHFGLFYRSAIRHSKELGARILLHDHMDFAAGKNIILQKMRCIAQSLVYRKNKIAIVSVNPQKDNAYFFAKHWYIPNGLSFIRNTFKEETREEIRTKLNIRENEKVCIFLGWDIYRKGLDIAVKAVNEIRRKDKSVLLCIVGMGDPPAPERLRFIADMAGIDPNSSWIRYLPSREDMFAYHKAADVYLSASRSEAFSYGILEAISQNVPVAVSDIKGTSWCHQYSKAVTYQTEDFRACANAIERALLLGRSDSNANIILNKYSIEKWIDIMIRAYNSILKY